MALRVCNYRGQDFEIAYDIVNPKKERNIIFLHGWGSNKEIMSRAFSDKLKGLRHIYIDMPGFGKSFNEQSLTTEDYANIISQFLKELNISTNIVAGHSFGGKVATLINPDCLILLSSAGISVPKPFIVKAKIAIFKLFRLLGVSKLRDIFVSSDAKGMSEGMYETFKYVVNEDFEPNFSNVTGKTLLFWGESDTATPLWTGEKIASIIPKAELFPLSGDHYFFLQHSQFIASKIEKICN